MDQLLRRILNVKPAIPVRILIMLAFATVAKGEYELLGDRPPPRMEMSISVSPDTALFGDTVTVVVSATNRDKDSITLYAPYGTPFEFQITDPTGAPVSIRRRGALVGKSLTLHPGAVVQDSFQVILMLPKPSTTKLNAAESAVVVPPAGTIYDPGDPRIPEVIWPVDGARIMQGIYRIEGGVRRQDFRWAAHELWVE